MTTAYETIAVHEGGDSSPLRALDPRALLLAAAGAALCFSCIRSLALSWACLGLAVVLAAARRLAPVPLLKQLAVANFFVLFVWLTVPLTMPGETVARLGALAWSGEGVRLALLVTLKCNAILLSFLALAGGLTLPGIGCALERLRVPEKLVFLFLFTCRYIHVIGEEWRRLQVAARLRGFAPRTDLHTYRTVGAMLGLTLINAIDRSRRIHEAMLLRGFRGTFHTVAEMKGTAADAAFVVIFFCLLGGLLALDFALK